MAIEGLTKKTIRIGRKKVKDQQRASGVQTVRKMIQTTIKFKTLVKKRKKTRVKDNSVLE